MAGIGGVVVQFRADADKAIRETRKFIRSLDDVDDKAGKAGRSLKKGLAAGVIGVGALFAGAGAALVQFGEAAVKDAAAQSRLKKTLENTTGATEAQTAAVEEWITQQGIALGVADDDLRPALARLVRSTEDVTKAQQLAQLAMDISASTGKPLQGVADALAKAYDGNTGALKRMGIKLGEGKKGWEELATSVDGSAQAQADSVEGTWERIKLIFSEGTEALGGVVLEPLESFAEWLKDPKHVKEVEDFLANTAEAAGAIGQDVVDRVKEFLAYVESPEGAANIRNMASAMKGLGDGILVVADAFVKVGGAFDKLPGILKTNIFEFLSPSGKYNPLNPDNMPWVKDEPRGQRGGSFGKTGDEGPVARGTRNNVQVIINNPKTERAEDSAALALRIARRTGGM